MTITRLWHASPALFDRPSIAGRIDNGHHANSGLGLFCATGPHDYIASFGGNIYEIALPAGARAMTITATDLRRLDDTIHADNTPIDGDNADPSDAEVRSWYDAEGRRLARDHDLILIAKENGAITQAIILNDTAIAACRLVDSAEFARISHPLNFRAAA